MIDKVSQSKCVLCGSCKNICPTNAISFDQEKFGFRYPSIDAELCIGCNKCEQVCPTLHEPEQFLISILNAYAGKCNNNAIRMKSTSGGVFWALANEVLKSAGAVCGAVFDKDFKVRHIVSDNPADVEQMMGSKYSQSDMCFCFQEIQALLKQDRVVLFSGCPCQIIGLRSFLKKEYPKLILLEVICHGIPGDQTLCSYHSLLEQKYHSRLTQLAFRNKKLGWHRSAVYAEFANGKKYSKPIVADAYMKAFLGNTTLKPSCYQCQFREGKSGADITVGDFWGAEIFFPDIDDNMGLSAILVHSDKGARLLKNAELELTQCNAEMIIKYNRNIVESPDPSLIREDFFRYAEQNGLDKAIQVFFWESRLVYIGRNIRYFTRCVWYRLRGRNAPRY